MGIDNLILIKKPTRQKVFEMDQHGDSGVDSTLEGGPDGSGSGDKKKRKWGAALMRMMDNAKN